jgi:S-adenosylmethionine:tRNA ribosyltransferase-isomerase
MNTAMPSLLQFDLPKGLACPKPTEERNLRRDEVRLLVTTKAGAIEHVTFQHFPVFLKKGDVLVVNTSATVAAAIPVLLPGRRKGRLHISTKLNHQEWLIEIREIIGTKTVRWKEGQEGMRLDLPAAALTLKKRFYQNAHWLQLWVGDLNTDQPIDAWLAEQALPIQYENLDQQYPLAWYQTFFSFHPGSSEMPSAGRGFTVDVVKRLLRKGVVFAPVVLHTGVSSLEEQETPYPEYMEIDPISTSIINTAKRMGSRIIAVGTTSVRVIETVANQDGTVMPYRGNTELFIDESYSMKVADGLLTGFHEPRASHLNMLVSIGGFEQIDQAYREAINAGYFWHQFGDLHLILP